MKQVDVAIIGGGPAGMTAAIELAAGGAKLSVIDAYPQLGGHYFKQSPKELMQQEADVTDGRQAEYRSLVNAVDKKNIEILSDTAVWSIFLNEEGTIEGQNNGRPDKATGFTLHLQGPHDVASLQARYLLLAPGAYDRPMAFPGWHLPGVITPGGAQMLLKGYGILPGKRVLVAGSGPLLLAVGAGLAEAGAEVVAVLDAASMWDGAFKIPAVFWGQKERVKDAWKYWSTLKRKQIPLLFGHAIFRALGEDAVTAAVYGRVDAQGRPIKQSEMVVEVDTICVALGFLPNLALTRHLECEHTYNATLDTFYPRYADTMETTVPNVFVAGDVTGVGGKDMSKLQGRAAGLSILGKLGYLSGEQVKSRLQPLQTGFQREERFIRMLQDRLQARPGLFEVIDDDTFICSCEMVTAGRIKAAIDDGAQDIRGVKLRTRCGMGACQGRYCESNVAHLISQATNRPRETVGTMSIRPPLIPILAGNILE